TRRSSPTDRAGKDKNDDPPEKLKTAVGAVDFSQRGRCLFDWRLARERTSASGNRKTRRGRKPWPSGDWESRSFRSGGGGRPCPGRSPCPPPARPPKCLSGCR